MYKAVYDLLSSEDQIEESLSGLKALSQSSCDVSLACRLPNQPTEALLKALWEIFYP